MQSSCDTLDVVEFKEDDNLTQMAAERLSVRLTSHALDTSTPVHHVARESETQSEEIGDVPCSDVGAAENDRNCDAASPCGKDNGNCGLLKSVNNEDSTSMSEVDESTIKRSPSAISDDDASSDEPSSANCFSGWDMDDGRTDIILYADYVYYCGVHYADSMVTFSRSSVTVDGKTVNGDQEIFHVQLEIENIVKIESKWSARCGLGTMNFYFIPNDAVGDETVNNSSVSGIQELKFPAVDSNWYAKREAIESLHMRYKELWEVVLDIEIDDCAQATFESKALLLSESYFPIFDESFEEVIYPEGDPDAVSISKRDVDLLLPETFVNDTIIDFYVKYLKNKQKPEDMNRFHFFNSFFFRKLADMDKDPLSAVDGRAAFQRVRKWTRRVNLLEKDFIFIPVNYNYHWSLVVICYFGEVADYEDVDASKLTRVPCILHMDSIKGNHAGVRDLIQSYLWEEWKERQKETREDLYSKFRNLKFVSLELPQQQNSYDCGLFLLHYVELFLEEVPIDFSIHNITSLNNFLNADWFPPGEASIKRAHIERLVYNLLENHSGGCSPNDTKIIDECKHAIKLVSEESSPLQGCHGSSLVGPGIEITLLPASYSRSNQCASNSGLVLREFLEPGSASGSFIDANSQGLVQRSSLNGIKRPISLVEEEVEAQRHLVYTTPAETAFQHLDVITPEASLFPYPCADFRLESGHKAALEDMDSSLATSVCDSDDSSELKVDEKRQHFGENTFDDQLDEPRYISEENGECLADCFGSASVEMLNAAEPDCHHFSKNLPDFYHELKELQSDDNMLRECLTDCPASASGDKMDVSEPESPIQMLRLNDRADPLACSLKNSPGYSHHDNDMHNDGGIGSESVSESDLQRAAKRMRIEPPFEGEERASNVSQDLQL